MDDSAVKMWELLRAKIAHEDAWVQQRAYRLLTSTALLVAAYAAIATVSSDVSIPQTLWRGYLMLLLPLFGFAFGLLVLLGTAGSVLAMRLTREEWVAYCRSREVPVFPKLQPEGKALWLASLSTWGIPIAVMILWVIVFVLTTNVI